MSIGATSGRYRRILLTGGSGFVGGYLAPAVAAAFPDADRLMLRLHDHGVERAGWRTVRAELTNEAEIDAVLRDFRPDLVLHLAAQSSVGAAHGAAEQTWRVNFGGSLELASACARYCPDLTFFFVSTSEVYGWSFRDGPACEETVPRPASAYSRSKAAAEAMLADVLPAAARLIVVRPFNHTGPGQDQRFVLPSFAAQVAAIESGLQPPRLEVGNLDAQRDFLDVRDVCAAYMKLLLADHPQGVRAIYNVASGSSYKISDLVEKMRARASRPFEIVLDPKRLRPSDVPLAVGSNERLYAATGWRPVVSIDEVIEDLLGYWRESQRGE
jgi:GDP-4-dehydro-6-deoxy-D-mannose reductase